jgi:hypothetical protein
MSKTPDQNDRGVREFAAQEPKAFGVIFSQLEDGMLQLDATARLAELCAELSRQADAIGKAKGTFALKLKISAERGGVVDIDADVQIVKPKPARHRSVMWLNGKGALSNENPKQLSLGVRDVSKPAEAPREAPAKARAVGHDEETGEITEAP